MDVPFFWCHFHYVDIQQMQLSLFLFLYRWKFAQTCVLEETVRRRRKMWSWEVIRAHRQLCAKYRDLYKSKLLANKPSSQLLADLEVLFCAVYRVEVSQFNYHYCIYHMKHIMHCTWLIVSLSPNSGLGDSISEILA